LPPISIRRFPRPINGWLGTVEPATKTWILFIAEKDEPLLYRDRDPSTGSVVQKLN
jgi:hypothetical protein